ncbi:MAG: hypothetical protein AAGL24_07800 [Pseudomonadota bacterium]
MPAIMMYCVHEDVSTLLDLLGTDIAFIVPDGRQRWRASREPTDPHEPRIALWHVPSGALPLIDSTTRAQGDQIADPWSGWQEQISGTDSGSPYFGDSPNVIWLNIRVVGREPESVCGMSSLEWLGNRYSSFRPAHPESTKWWRKIRRRVARLACKVPRGGADAPGDPEVFAFPHAAARLGKADRNPFSLDMKNGSIADGTHPLSALF